MFLSRVKQPIELKKLMKANLWPSNHDEAIRQNLKQRIPKDRIHRLIESEDEIILYPNPSATLATDHAESSSRIGGSEYYVAYAKTLEQIDPKLALLIADFGLGSDAPIALDMRNGSDDPPVIGLSWDKPWKLSDANRWVLLSPSFSHFVDALELWDLPKI